MRIEDIVGIKDDDNENETSKFYHEEVIKDEIEEKKEEENEEHEEEENEDDEEEENEDDEEEENEDDEEEEEENEDEDEVEKPPYDEFYALSVYDTLIQKQVQMDFLHILFMSFITCLVLPSESLPWYFGIILASMFAMKMRKNSNTF